MKPAIQKGCYCGPAANNSEVTNDTAHLGAVHQTYDPVCGMIVDPASARWRAQHGRSYYFCCGDRQAKFLADPVQFLSPVAKLAPSVPSIPSAPVAQVAIYTCPMHPQIRRSEPGSCPIWRQTKANKAVNCSRFPRKSDCLVIDRNLREFRGM